MGLRRQLSHKRIVRSALHLENRVWPGGNSWWMASVLFAVQGTLVLSASVLPVTCLLGIPLLIFGVILTAFSVRRLLLTLVFLIVAIPIMHYRVPAIPVGLSYKIIGLLFGTLLFWYAVHVLNGGLRVRRSSLDVPLALFLILGVASAVIGFLKGHRSFFIVYELFFLSLYLTYWILVHGAGDERFIRVLFVVLAVATVIASMEYLYVALTSRRLLVLTTGRIVTRQATMAIVAVPYLVTGLFFPLTKRQRIASLTAIGLTLPLLLLSQQRAMWISLAVSLLFVWTVLWKRRKVSFRHCLVGLILVAIACAAAGRTVALLQGVTGLEIGQILKQRFMTFWTVSRDPAMLYRIQDYASVVRRIRTHPFVGCGLGDEVFQPSTKMSTPFVDNSFLIVLWKTGVPGLCAYLWLVVSFFRRGFYVIRKATDERTLVLAISTVASFLGVLCVGLSAATLLGYRFIIVWASLLAAIDILARRAAKEERGWREVT